jgi:AbrB family looped-hinge helix DNA binding protein
MTKATVSSKGQIAIPKAVRERLKLTAGTEISIDVQGEALVLKRLVPDFPDWRTMQGMIREGESLTQALGAEHRDELATMPNCMVVDSWALLAWLRDEQPAAAGFGIAYSKRTEEKNGSSSACAIVRSAARQAKLMRG